MKKSTTTKKTKTNKAVAKKNTKKKAPAEGSAWSRMSDEEKEVMKQKNRDYLHTRKAKQLGISLEEYRARLGDRASGKSAKEAGLRTSIRISRVPPYMDEMMRMLIAKVPIADTAKPYSILKNNEEVKVLFRKGKLLVVNYLRKVDALEGQGNVPMYFVNLETKKQFPFFKEKDYVPSENKKNEMAVLWENATALI